MSCTVRGYRIEQWSLTAHPQISPSKMYSYLFWHILCIPATPFHSQKRTGMGRLPERGHPSPWSSSPANTCTFLFDRPIFSTYNRQWREWWKLEYVQSPGWDPRARRPSVDIHGILKLYGCLVWLWMLECSLGPRTFRLRQKAWPIVQPKHFFDLEEPRYIQH